MFPFSSSTPVPPPAAPDPGAQQPTAPAGNPETSGSLPPLSPQPTVTPAAGEIPSGGTVQFNATPAPDPSLAPPMTPATDPGLAAQTDAPPAQKPGNAADEVKTMTTKEAIRILHELLEIGEFLKVRNGAMDVLLVDPANAEALRLRDEAQVLLDNPQEVQRLREAGRAQARQRKVVVTGASILMMAALGLEGWAFFGETPIVAPPPVEITYNVMIKSDPIKTEGDAPLTVTFDVRAPIPDGVSVLFDSGDGETKPPPYTRTFVKPGKYPVKAVATGPLGKVLSEDTQQVVVTEKLTTTITAIPGTDSDSLTVVFSSSVSGSGGAPVTYAWDFGDGRSDTAANPTHTYDTAGNYQVKLLVNRADGSHGEATTSVEVYDPVLPTDIPPTTIETPSSVPPSSVSSIGAVDAVITTIPKSLDGRTIAGSAPFTVYFSSGSSKSENGQLSSAHWNFGDSYDSDELSVFHTYSRAGLYKVQLTVSDGAGITGTETLTVNVRAPSVTSPVSGPVSIKVETDVPMKGAAPLSITFDASGSGSTKGKITDYEWDFGDGSTLGSTARISHVFQSAGKYTVRLTVTDDKGTSAKKTFTVTVS